MSTLRPRPHAPTTDESASLADDCRIPQLHTRELQAFVLVARMGTFREVGRHLYLDGSTVSKLVSRLERRLDLQLVVRSTSGIELSEAGRVVLPAVEAALQAVRDLARHGRPASA